MGVEARGERQNGSERCCGHNRREGDFEMDIQTRVRTYIRENFFLGDDTPLGATQSLIDSGVVDSTGIMELVLFLEETYGFQIRDEEMLPQNLDTLENIARFVERKTAERACATKLLRVG